MSDDKLAQDAIATVWMERMLELNPEQRWARMATSNTICSPRKILQDILSYSYFAQVRHHFISNGVFVHMNNQSYIARPVPVQASEFVMNGIALAGVSFAGVPFDRNFSMCIKHDGIREIMDDYYKGMTDLKLHHRLSEVPGIEAALSV
jgi:hypothetical protein